MKKYRVGLIRVLTTDDTQLMQMHGALIEQYFPHAAGRIPLYSRPAGGDPRRPDYGLRRSPRW